MDVEGVILFIFLVMLVVTAPIGCIMEESHKHEEKMECLKQHMTIDECNKWRSQ